MRRVLAVTLLAPLLVRGLAGCGTDQGSYCEAVEARQAELTDIVSSTRPDALLRAQSIFEELEERAPDDIADDWDVLVDAVEDLDAALEDAGVEPGSYDPTDPPADVSVERREAIAEASRRLASPEVADALRAVDQQVRDVCHTPLTM